MEEQQLREPRTVVELRVENFKRVRAVHAHPSRSGVVPVRGRNAQGKSSAIQALVAALKGPRVEKVEMPIRKDAVRADVEIGLAPIGSPEGTPPDIVIKSRWARDSGGEAKSPVVTVEAANEQLRSPRSVLDSLVGHFADPVAFDRLPDSERVKVVLGVAGLDTELERLEENVGRFYDRRRDVGREAERTEKAVEQLRAELRDAPEVPPGSIDGLAAELQAGEKTNAERDRYKAAMAETEIRGAALAARVVELEAELAAAKGDLVTTRHEWEQANEAAAAITPVELEPIRERIRQHEEAARFTGKRELLATVETEAEAARAVYHEADKNLDAARAAVQELLGKADYPIEGMSYDHEHKRLLVNGVPYSDASQAERLSVAAAVAMAGDPPFQVLFARDGSLLDDESYKRLDELAASRGFQLFLEIVDSDKEGVGLWIEDGEGGDA